MALVRTLLLPLLFAAPLLRGAEDEPAPPGAGEFRFLPVGPGIAPLPAHPREPRVGVRKELGGSRLKLDIGVAMDLVEVGVTDQGSRLRVGIDFFTLGLTTSSQGLRLQVDAVDGFFGGHLSFLHPFSSSTLGLRLRLLHLSAHMVDGHYDVDEGAWIDGRAPIPFTKDYGELTAIWTGGGGAMGVRAHAGVSYATLVRPPDLRRAGGLAGLELRLLSWPGTLWDHPAGLYAAWNICLDGIPAWAGSHTVEFGIKAGGMESRGIRLYGSYYSGLEVFSQYYNERRSFWAAGFAFDL